MLSVQACVDLCDAVVKACIYYPMASHSATVPSQFFVLFESPGCSAGVFRARGGLRGSWGYLGAQSCIFVDFLKFIWDSLGMVLR